MSSEHTEQQDSSQIKSSRDLSMKPKSPPAAVPGYTIESLLGSGAYGEVWLAVDQKTGRRVAIKFYTRKTSLDFSLLSREVEKLVFLSADRYVVQLLDVGWDAKPPYYVMDYIENGALEDELKRRTVLPVDEAIELTEEICIGLMHLHGKGILHCDLKPGNVLLDQDKKPRLADFGQSRLSHEQAPALGTLFFMAPEQANLKAAPDARWDVYALGALLYCMLTGEPPFRDETLIKKIESSEAMEDRLLRYRELIESAPKPTAHRKIPGVDRNLADIIDRCIERNPKRRFGSVQSVFEALRERELAMAKRPLIILGLLGPLLLLGVMSLFGWNAYRGAISQTDESITEQTLESSQLVAKLAARSAAEQIDNYFRVLDELVNEQAFKNLVKIVVDDPDVQTITNQLVDPHLNKYEVLDPLREQLKTRFPLRLSIEQRLQRNLDDRTYPQAASWFVCDSGGTQIASVFPDANRNKTVGNNYSYRSYFTGRDQVAEVVSGSETRYDVNEDPAQREHITQPTMSAIFLSTATNKWKIAFAAPIYEGDRFLGIAAITADMGSFIEFGLADDQYVMLVDGRRGQYQGTVLEHPLLADLSKRQSEDKSLPVAITESLISQKVGSAVLKSFTNDNLRLVPFLDPMSNDPVGTDYDRDWLASWADVQIRNGAANDSASRLQTGLKVIAVADRNEAMQPSRQLGSTLAKIAAFAITFFLLVTAGLLYFVFRSVSKSREKVNRMLGITTGNTATGESGSSFHDAATMVKE